jgi:uncharacterized protein YqjF (DUF2071 family)
MRHTWASLAFLHWPYDPVILQPRLAPGLTVDTHDGAGYIGLILFHLTVRTPHLPALPWASAFAEINVRTYVRGPDGQPGIVFLSLDAARLGAVAIARVSPWRLPYHWAAIRLDRRGDLVTYTARRRWPTPRSPATSAPVTSRAVIRIGEPYQSDQLTRLDRFLTDRWCFYAQSRAGLTRTAAHHPPWQLSRATVVEVSDRLITASGIPQPDGEPLALWADGTVALIGRPIALGDRHLLATAQTTAWTGDRAPW